MGNSLTSSLEPSALLGQACPEPLPEGAASVISRAASSMLAGTTRANMLARSRYRHLLLLAAVDPQHWAQLVFAFCIGSRAGSELGQDPLVADAGPNPMFQPLNPGCQLRHRLPRDPRLLDPQAARAAKMQCAGAALTPGWRPWSELHTPWSDLSPALAWHGWAAEPASVGLE